MAMQVQERQEKSHENLILSMHHEDKENKYKVNEPQNIKVEAGKNKVNVPEIEDNRDR